MKSHPLCFILVFLLAKLAPVCSAADLLDNWTWRNPLPSGQLANAFTYGNNLHVAVGAYGTIVTSPDGVTWRLESSGVTTTLFDVAYGNGLFVAVGMNGRMLTSADGHQWTSRPSGTGSHLFRVAWGDGGFVAVGLQVTTRSPDGLTWSPGSNTAGMNAIVFGNHLYVAVGNQGGIRTSTDGVNWTARTSGTTAPLGDIAFGNGVFIAVGGELGNSAVLRSTDGVSWTRLTSGAPPNGRSIAYGNGRFVLIEEGSVTTRLWNSPDGLQWTRFTGPFSMNCIDFGESEFLVSGWTGEIATSPDGVSWAKRTTSVTSANLYDVVFAGGTYVAVGGAIVTSPDGQTWTERASATTQPLRRVTYGQELFVSVGDAGKVLTSPNGAQWVRQVSGTTFNLNDVAYGNGQFLAAGANAARTQRAVLASANGTNWTVSVETGSPLSGLAFGNGIFVAVGEAGAIRTSTDGVGWTPRASGTSAALNDVTFGGGQFAAVGNQGTIVTSPDGVTWTRRLNTGTGSDSMDWAGFGGGVLFASAIAGPTFISTDGVRWTRRPASVSGAFAGGGGQFIVVSGSGSIRSCDARPRLGAVSFLPDGTPQIPLWGVSGLGYVIEASSDLTDWNTLTTVQASTGTGDFVDLAATNSSHRFYRAISAP